MEPGEVCQYETARGLLTEHLAEEANISGVIFNQKHLE
jgi:hypothetical protein